MKDTLLVTGAAGQLGRQILDFLLESGAAGSIIAATRSPDKLSDYRARGIDVRAADFDDEAGLQSAFRGAKRALLISTDAVGVPGKRLSQHQRAVRAFAAAGVKHALYTSIPDADKSKITLAPDHAGTEQAIVEAGLSYTFLRNNHYADLLLGPLAGAVATGQLLDAKGNGKVAYVTRQDCARTAAAALADSERTGREILDVTGPAAVSSEELASILSELSGRPVRHVSVPVAAVVQAMVQHGLPEPVARIFASFDSAIAAGELARATDTVERVTREKPRALRDFLSAHKAQLAGK